MKKYKVITLCLDGDEGPIQREEEVEAQRIEINNSSIIFSKGTFNDIIAIYPANFTTVKLIK